MANEQTTPTTEATEKAEAARKIQQAVQAQADAPATPAEQPAAKETPAEQNLNEQTPAEPTPAEPAPARAAYDVTQDTAPVPKTVLKRKNWFVRHKVLTVILVVLLALVIFIVYSINKVKAAMADTAYQFVRTTTLQKTSLDNSVTATGTVSAGSTASVTVSDSAKLYKVTEVLVKVGDDVKEGAVIAHLDTTDVLKSIEKAKQDYTDTLTAAQTSYTRAQDDYNTAVVEHDNKLIDLQAKIDEAQDTLTKAQEKQNTAQDEYNAAESSYGSIKGAYDTAQGQISTFQQDYNYKEQDLNTKLSELNAAIADYHAQLAACAVDAGNYVNLCPVAERMIQAYCAYNGNGVNYGGSSLAGSTAANTVSSGVANTVNIEAVEYDVNQYYPTKDWKVADVFHKDDYFASSLAAYETAAKNLADAQSNVSNTGLGYSNLTEMETALKTAETTKTQAETALDQAKTATESADKSVTAAKQNYDTEKNSTTLKQKSQSVEDAKTKLTQAQRTPDNLTTLETTLQNCTLTATMSGTVTALNATVGSVCTGAVATIQNTDALTVKVTIAADKVADVKTGMPCSITADTTADTVSGTLTQIDPVANDQGTFGAEVSVAGSDSGLLIGTSAQVEIMQSRTDDVFVVPLDAIGTAEDGSSFVYRKTGGEGTDMTFEEVPVTTGAANDYYTEITGDMLAEGDVVRSSADLTQGIESSANTEDAMSAMMGGGISVEPADDAGGADRGNRGNGGGAPAGGAPGGM